MTSLLVSIILPAYNAEKYISEAIKSILDQTYKNFELIIIDDGSKDNTAQIVSSINDSRIVFLKQENQGMSKTLNRGIEIAKGELIARQDADDISYPQRIQKQVDHLTLHKDVGLVGTWSVIIDGDGKHTGRFHKHPSDPIEIKLNLFFDNPFVHSSVMFRKSVISKCGGYDNSLHPLIQDFEFWFRISKNFDVANIPEILQEYREINTGISKSTVDFSKIVAEQCANNILSVLVNEDPEMIKRLSIFHHSNTGPIVNSALFRKFKRVIHKLVKETSGRSSKKYSHEPIKYLKRKFYNQYIYSKTAPWFINFYYRINRRILIYSEKLV